jgi:hypothetical protein
LPPSRAVRAADTPLPCFVCGASPDIELRYPAALIKEIRIHSTLIERPPGASDSFSMPLGKLQHVKCHSNPPLIQVV